MPVEDIYFLVGALSRRTPSAQLAANQRTTLHVRRRAQRRETQGIECVAACSIRRQPVARKKSHLQSREERRGQRRPLFQRPRRCRIHSAGRKKHTCNSFTERRAAPGSQRGTPGWIKCKIEKIMAAVGCGLLLSLAIPAAFCQKSATPPEITPTPGNVLFLVTHAQGTQNYICEPSSNGKAAGYLSRLMPCCSCPSAIAMSARRPPMI
jgi:hypothetical protein